MSAGGTRAVLRHKRQRQGLRVPAAGTAAGGHLLRPRGRGEYHVGEPPEAPDGPEAPDDRAGARDHRRADRDPGDPGGEGARAGARDGTAVAAGIRQRGAGTGSAAGARGHDPRYAKSEQTTRRKHGQLHVPVPLQDLQHGT